MVGYSMTSDLLTPYFSGASRSLLEQNVMYSSVGHKRCEVFELGRGDSLVRFRAYWGEKKAGLSRPLIASAVVKDISLGIGNVVAYI